MKTAIKINLIKRSIVMAQAMKIYQKIQQKKVLLNNIWGVILK